MSRSRTGAIRPAEGCRSIRIRAPSGRSGRLRFRTADVRGAEPPLLADPSLAEPPHPLQTPDRLSIVPEEVRTVPKARKARDQQPQAAEPGPIRPLSLGGPDEASRRNVQGDLAEVETVDLMRCLRAEDEPTASRARTELTRRGFQAVHLELARRVFDPDPETRMRLARSLPALQGVDAIPWLLWLARDADAEVRLVAITLLATTGDPKLLEQVEHMARQDPDPHPTSCPGLRPAAARETVLIPVTPLKGRVNSIDALGNSREIE